MHKWHAMMAHGARGKRTHHDGTCAQSQAMTYVRGHGCYKKTGDHDGEDDGDGNGDGKGMGMTLALVMVAVMVVVMAIKMEMGMLIWRWMEVDGDGHTVDGNADDNIYKHIQTYIHTR